MMVAEQAEDPGALGTQVEGQNQRSMRPLVCKVGPWCENSIPGRVCKERAQAHT